MLGDYFGERLLLEFIVRYDSSKLDKSQVFTVGYSCGVFFRKNDSLGELRYKRFITIFISRLDLFKVLDCK